MAQFSDIGAHCAEPSCARQVYLPFVCGFCSLPFCEDHYRQDSHHCGATTSAQRAAASPEQQAPVQRARCAAAGCKEVLGSHNTFRCWRCRQDVCIRHRFEEDHPCRPLQEAVQDALATARRDMRPEDYVEAHKTLTRVFGNIVAEPGNEKFRTLKKANAVVQEKLKHPACVQALLLCGFTDTGEAYVCRPTADLELMRQMTAALKAIATQKELAGTSSASSAASPPASGGTRVVNGVIVRAPKPEELPPRAGPAACVAAAAAAPMAAALSSGASAAPVAAPKAKADAKPARSTFDFERRSDREAKVKSQQTDLNELRRLQKQRYQENSGGAAGTAPRQPPAGPPGADAGRLAPQQLQQQAAGGPLQRGNDSSRNLQRGSASSGQSDPCVLQ